MSPQFLGPFILCALAETVLSQAKPVEVLSPNGGETFGVGDTLVITWQTDTAAVRSVAVDLSPDNGFNWFPLVEGGTLDLYEGTAKNPDWGRYAWIIRDSLEDGLGVRARTVSDSCRVKVWDPYGNLDQDKSDRVFSIRPADIKVEAVNQGPAALFRLYPNPGRLKGPLNLSARGEALTVLKWTDSRGRRLALKPLAVMHGQAWVVDGIAPGTYFLNGLSGGKSFTLRFLFQP